MDDKVVSGRVSPGNTADLIGRFNNLSANETRSSGNFLSPNDRFRKTSAFVSSPTTTQTLDPKLRKTSAMVLMPTKSALKTKSAYDQDSVANSTTTAASESTVASLTVSPRAVKKVSLLTPSPHHLNPESPRTAKKVSLLTPCDPSHLNASNQPNLTLHTPGVSSSDTSSSDDDSSNSQPEVVERKKTYVISSGLGGILGSTSGTSSTTCTNLGRSKSVCSTRVKHDPSIEGKTSSSFGIIY